MKPFLIYLFLYFLISYFFNIDDLYEYNVNRYIDWVLGFWTWNIISWKF